jgi:hypothetical protein
MRKPCLAIVIPVLVGVCLSVAVPGRTADERGERRKTSTANQISRVPIKDVKIVEFTAPENLGGEVQVRTDVDAQDALIEVNETVYNVAEADQADRILKSITVETGINNGILQVQVKSPEDAEWEGTNVGVQVDLAILLPPGLKFRGTSEHYNFDLAGPLSEVGVTGRYGKIRVEDVTGLANVRSEYGALTLISVEGTVDISNHYGTATLENIKVGDTPLRVRGERGSVILKHIDGPVDISADDAAISIEEWTLVTGESRVVTQNSPINISFAQWGDPEVLIEDRRSKIEIVVNEDFSAAIRLALREEGRGFIRTRGLPIKATRLNQKTLEGIAGNGGGLLQVNNSYGDITLRGPGARPGGDESL